MRGCGCDLGLKELQVKRLWDECDMNNGNIFYIYKYIFDI